MKIMILTNYANGLYLFRKELLAQFLKDGHEVVVSIPFDENRFKIEKLGCRVIEAHLERRGSNPVHDLKLLGEYLACLKVEKPEMVLTYTIKPNLYGGLACRIRKIPYLMNITGLGTAIEHKSLLSRALLLLYRIASAKAARVFFQNEKNRDFMQSHGIAKENAALLPGSGVNLKEHPFREYPSEREGIRFLAVLRIMKDKGIGEYLDAVQSLAEKRKDISFYLAGEYEEDSRSLYEPRITELQKQGKLEYLGHIDNVEQVMTESHVIVHPSYHEGLSNVLLEAAACGRPVLATNVSGCRETFLEGKSGIGFSKESSQDLIRAVQKILSMTEEQRRDMGAAGRAYVEERFDRQIIIDTYEKEIETIKENRKWDCTRTL